MRYKAIGDYKIYEDGRVVSAKWKKERILKWRIHSHGYYKVCLRINKKNYDVLVHRLIASLFIPNPENKPTVDHIDGNKANNAATNLRWATAYENYHNPNTVNKHFKRSNKICQ